MSGTAARAQADSQRLSLTHFDALSFLSVPATFVDEIATAAAEASLQWSFYRFDFAVVLAVINFLTRALHLDGALIMSLNIVLNGLLLLFGIHAVRRRNEAACCGPNVGLLDGYLVLNQIGLAVGAVVVVLEVVSLLIGNGKSVALWFFDLMCTLAFCYLTWRVVRPCAELVERLAEDDDPRFADDDGSDYEAGADEASAEGVDPYPTA
jgi:hypothetical protein